MMDRSEALALEGDADGSLAMTEAAERFCKQHDALRERLTVPERTKTVCETCGVFMNSTDNEARRQVRRRSLATLAHARAANWQACK